MKREKASKSKREKRVSLDNLENMKKYYWLKKQRLHAGL